MLGEQVVLIGDDERRTTAPDDVRGGPVPETTRVLVTDDSATVRETQRWVLQHAGFAVITACDGGDALRVLAEHAVDLLLVDLSMPGMDGLQLTRFLRAEPRHAALPIIVVSGSDDPAARSRALAAGADAFTVKDAHDDAGLLETIESVLASRRPGAVPPLPAADAPTVLVADDSLLIRAVVRATLEAEGYQVVEAENGTQVVEGCADIAPDVVLLDIGLPDMSGFDVLTALKADVRVRHVPVLFLTALSNTSDVVTGLRAGAHDYLTKPFRDDELLARVAAATTVKQLHDALRERNDQLDRLSRTDALTGLANRRHVDAELSRQCREATRRREPLSVVLFDLDHFKSINDRLGHLGGDDVLQGFAALLAAELRPADTAARWGGEEFLVVLPRTDLDEARAMAERLRALVAARTWPGAPEGLVVTVSGGCAAGCDLVPEALTAGADRCLYEAKRDGRNRIVSAIVPSGAPR